MFLHFFLTPLLLTVFSIFVLYPWALKVGFTDKPTHRKQHQKHTPIISGIAMYFAIVFTLIFSDPPFPNQLEFIIAATLLVCVGLIDDYKGLSVNIRFMAQIVAVLIMVEFAHLKIIDLGNLLGLGDIHLGSYANIFTILAVVGGINAFNMIDGIDGLAGGLTLISIASIAVLSWIFQDWVLFKFSVIFIASILGFLFFNLRIFGRTNAKIFMGDTGSTLLGFTVCWLLIDVSQGEKNLITPATVLWLTALPLNDSLCIMLRRLRRGRSPFLPDREHFHHVFHVIGFSVNQTLIAILSLALILSFSGIINKLLFNIPDYILFTGFILILAIHYWLINHAWRMIKIFRYLHITKLFDRRVKNQKVENDRRSRIDRRYIPTQNELKKINNSNRVLLTILLGQHFRQDNEE